MKNKIIALALSALLFALCLPVWAQQPTNMAKIGFLTGGGHDSARNDAFRQGLRELGYVEGKNTVIEWRAAERKPGRLAALAADLVRLKVDVIVVTGLGDLRAAKEALPQFPLSWLWIAILLEVASLPAWRDQEGTLPDCPPSPRS
jgi:ABC-type uncharacterized transport system substrate-binding protein